MQRPRPRARLWLAPEAHVLGRTFPPEWMIFVGGERFRTGCGPDEVERATQVAAQRLKEMAEKAKAPAAAPRTGQQQRRRR